MLTPGLRLVAWCSTRLLTIPGQYHVVGEQKQSSFGTTSHGPTDS